MRRSGCVSCCSHSHCSSPEIERKSNSKNCSRARRARAAHIRRAASVARRERRVQICSPSLAAPARPRLLSLFALCARSRPIDSSAAILWVANARQPQILIDSQVQMMTQGRFHWDVQLIYMHSEIAKVWLSKPKQTH
jgi:hypothetical protein